MHVLKLKTCCEKGFEEKGENSFQCEKFNFVTVILFSKMKIYTVIKFGLKTSKIS